MLECSASVLSWNLVVVVAALLAASVVRSVCDVLKSRRKQKESTDGTLLR